MSQSAYMFALILLDALTGGYEAMHIIPSCVFLSF